MLYGQVVLAIVALVQAAAPTTSSTFCGRMAATLGMKPVARDAQGRSTGEWRTNVLSVTQRLLTGGTSMISFAVQPVGDEPTVDDYKRLQSVCQQGGKELLCRVEEPLVLIVSAGQRKAEIEAKPGERAQVGTKGSHLFCRDPQAFKKA